MEEAKDRAIQFEKELKALLKKWDTAIEIEDVGIGYSPDYVMKCYIDSIYKDGDCIAEYTEIDLGRYVDSD